MAAVEIAVYVEDLVEGDEIVAYSTWSFDHGTQTRTGSWVVNGVYWMAADRLADVYTNHGLLGFRRGQQVTIRRLAAPSEEETSGENASVSGQQFAKEMRRFLSVGTRTRRNRKGLDLNREIAEWVKSAAMEPGTLHPDQEAVFKAAFDAACSWYKWIKMGRADYRVCEYVNNLSPHQFCALLGDMIDAGVKTTSQGARYFDKLRGRLYAQAA